MHLLDIYTTRSFQSQTRNILLSYIHNVIHNSNVQGLGSTAKYLVPPANTRANFIILSFGVARCIKLGLFQDAAINMS